MLIYFKGGPVRDKISLGSLLKARRIWGFIALALICKSALFASESVLQPNLCEGPLSKAARAATPSEIDERGPTQSEINALQGHLPKFGLHVDVPLEDSEYRDLVIDKLMEPQLGYTNIASLAQGGEAFVVRATKGQQEVCLKFPRITHRKPEDLTAEFEVLHTLAEAAQKKGKHYFPSPGQLNLGTHISPEMTTSTPLVAMETPLIRNSQDPLDPDYHRPALSLRDRLRLSTKDHDALTDQMLKRMVPQLIEAISIAHSTEFKRNGKIYRGIVNRDLKPDNILVDKHGNVYITDWGISMPMGTFRARDSFLGTMQYSSENSKKGGPADAIDDVEPLWKIFYEVLGRKNKQTLAERKFQREGYSLRPINEAPQSSGDPVHIWDYVKGPEFERYSPQLQIALCNRLATNMDEVSRLFNLVSTTASWKEFANEFGKELRKSVREGNPPLPYRAVRTIIDYKILADSPLEDLGFTNPRDIDLLETTVKKMKQATEDDPAPLLGYHGFGYYEELIKQIENWKKRHTPQSTP